VEPALESDMQLVTDIIGLATLPARSELAAARFHQTQLSAAEETLRVAHEARRVLIIEPLRRASSSTS
jgi:hypothetical protein